MDLVRLYFVDATDEECEFILWERTALPFCSVITAERQIEEFKNKS